jgi:hypothetical protein
MQINRSARRLAHGQRPTHCAAPILSRGQVRQE